MHWSVLFNVLWHVPVAKKEREKEGGGYSVQVMDQLIQTDGVRALQSACCEIDTATQVKNLEALLFLRRRCFSFRLITQRDATFIVVLKRARKECLLTKGLSETKCWHSRACGGFWDCFCSRWLTARLPPPFKNLWCVHSLFSVFNYKEKRRRREQKHRNEKNQRTWVESRFDDVCLLDLIWSMIFCSLYFFGLFLISSLSSLTLSFWLLFVSGHVFSSYG